jgi:hypothetical protein
METHRRFCEAGVFSNCLEGIRTPYGYNNVRLLTVHFILRDLPPRKSYNSAISIITAPHLYSAGTWFESQTVQRVSSLSFFIAVSQSFRMNKKVKLSL